MKRIVRIVATVLFILALAVLAASFTGVGK